MALPPAQPYESPVEHAIREATEQGAFDNLAGAGKPLPDTGFGDDWMLRRYLQTGDGANTGFLPPSLLLRREVEDLPERARAVRTEQAVRALVADLNTRIRDEIRMPSWGPPLALRQVDVGEVLARWRHDRQAAAEKQAADGRAIAEIRAARDARSRRIGRRGRVGRGNLLRSLMPPWRWRRRDVGGRRARASAQ